MDNDSYMEMVINKNKGKINFPNWNFTQEDTTGCFLLECKWHDLILHATPYWNCHDGVAIMMSDADNTEILTEIVPFTITYDNEKDFIAYLQILTAKIKLIDFVITKTNESI